MKKVNLNNDKREDNCLKPIEKEYDMVRSQIDKAIERMDKYNLQAITVLLLNVFFQSEISVYIYIMGVFVALILLCKIIECRNMVFYNAMYLVVFVEDENLGLQYESRVQKLYSGMKKTNLKGLRRLLHSIYMIGYKLKHTMIGVFSIIVVGSFIIRNSPITGWLNWIKVIILSMEAMTIVIFTICLLFDGVIKKEYKRKWEEIKGST